MEKYYYKGEPLEIGNYVTINDVTVCITHRFLLDNVELFDKEREIYLKCVSVNTDVIRFKNFTKGKVYSGILKASNHLSNVVDDENNGIYFTNDWNYDYKVESRYTQFIELTKKEYILHKAKEMYPPGTRIKNSEGEFTIATKPFLPRADENWLSGIYYIASDGYVLAMVEGTSRGCYLIENGRYSKIIPKKDLEYYLKLAIEKVEDKDFSLRMSYLKVLKEISKDLDPDFEPKIGNTKYFIHQTIGELKIGKHESVKYPMVYFKSEKSAKKAIEILGENIKYVV